MRAAVVRARNQIGVETVAEPAIGAYDALVRIINCGVCTGTDRHILSGDFPWMAPYPFILGHESIGRVVEIGARVRYLKPGDLVLRPTAVRSDQTLNGVRAVWGGYAEYGVVADAQAILEDTPRSEQPRLPQFATAQQIVPADFDPVDAGMFITFKETLSWMHDLGPMLGRTIAIFGTGPVGLCFARIAKFLGATQVIIVGRRDERLELARQMGADAGVNVTHEDLVAAIREQADGRGVDYAVEAVGNTDLLVQGTHVLADGGQIAVYGVPPVLEAPLNWHGLAPSWQLRSIRPREDAVHKLALDLIRLGFIDLRSFVTHVLPLSEIGEAFRMLNDRRALKIAIRLEDEGV